MIQLTKMPLLLGTTPWRDHSVHSAQQLSEQARRAETLGYSSFWLPEHHFQPGGFPDPLMSLAAVAAATSHILLATTSLLITLRNPLQLAEQVAVLDQLSKGRVLLGLGRGFSRIVLQAFGVDPRDKRKLFEDNLKVMVDLWSGANLSAVKDAAAESEPKLTPTPYQRPHPPLWVAAFGPKALTQAGGLGLPYLASPIESLEQLKTNYGLHRDAINSSAGDDLLPVPVMRTVCIVDSARERKQLVARMDQALLTRVSERRQVALEDWAIIGERAEVAERIARYQQHLGMTHLIVTGLGLGAHEHRERTIEELPDLIRHH